MAEETRSEHEQFENDVRRIARALWPSAEFSGAAMEGSRETDGIFETEECIHIIEATTSRRQDKAKYDIAKLTKLLDKYQRKSTTHAVRGWFITRDEPTADQRTVTNKHRSRINTLSFSQFQSQLIDSHSYLNIRERYAFGSIQSPVTGRPQEEVKYVPLDLVDINSKESVSHHNLLKLIGEGSTIVLLGDYGAGKSMTLREVYRDLRKLHLKNQSARFPVYLNLRDHHGQTDPAEVLTRHATSIGFDKPAHLIRAWRAGYVHLLIDGFDEMYTIAIQGLWHDLSKNRRRALEAARRMIREHPSSSSLIITGRAHFFNNAKERRKALDLPPNAIEISLSEFTTEQIDTYLKGLGYTGFVPSWLPSRPLLIGYLAANGFLRDLLMEQSNSEGMGPADGWDFLLDRVASREARIEAGIDGGTVRRLLERLSTTVRTPESGVGSITQDSLIDVFRDICGYKPDEGGMVILQRLPGLGIHINEETCRTFIDESFADACKAGDLVEFVESPFEFPEHVLTEIESPIGHLGIQVAALKMTKLISQDHRKGKTEGKINAALAKAQAADSSYMAADITRMISEIGIDISEQVTLNGLYIPDLELGASKANLSKVQFRNCFFSRIEFDLGVDEDRIPLFLECYITEVEGRVSRRDLTAARFDEKCEIERFTSGTETTAEVLSLDLPLSVRVCLTILKKLYDRSGTGRKENSLFRGLDDHARRLVPGVLRILQAEGITIPRKIRGVTIWIPSRSARKRVGRMISAPNVDRDPVLQKCAVRSD